MRNTNKHQQIRYKDDRRRINATEMDALRRSARISKLDRKTNEYIRGKMDAQDMLLDDITQKQLIWYGYVERMNPNFINFKYFMYLYILMFYYISYFKSY